jgi:hypothetical protein
MQKNVLREISNFSKNNNNYSDLNIVNNLLRNLNFTKYRFNNNNFNKNSQIGGVRVCKIGEDGNEYCYEDGFTPIENVPTFINQNFDPTIQNDLALQQEREQIINNLQNETGKDREDIEEAVDASINEEKTDNQMMGNPVMDNQMMGNPVMDNQMMANTMIGNQQMNPMIGNQSQPMFLNKFLVKPDFVSNQIKTYTIQKGVNLYYASNNKKGFNPDNIQLGNDNLISFFTPNFKLASDRIGSCDINNPNGYIHAFEVVQDIPNIYVKLPYDTDYDYTLKSLYDKFCAGSTQYNGVGFFYPKNEIEIFSNVLTNQNQNYQNQNQSMGFQSLPEENFYSEFGICNPTPYLKYLYSCKCQGLRQLSSTYRIDKGFQ